MHTITVQFESEDQAVGWFGAAQALGAIPEEAGLRHKDALDRSAQGRAHPGDLLVTSAAGVRCWLVEPESLRRRLEAADRAECHCGHEAYWHGNAGKGSCEHNAECRCAAFTVPEVSA